MQVNSTQRNLGFSSTAQELKAYLKSPRAKEDGVRLSCKIRSQEEIINNPPGRKFCVFLTTDPKGSQVKNNVTSAGKDMFAFGKTAREAFDKLAKISDGLLSYTKKVKI